MRGHRDLRFAVFAAFLCAIGALVLPVEFIRLLFAGPLTLLLPGYAIAAATLVRRPPTRLQLIPLSIGLSLATLALGGLLLNYLPGGLRSGPWALLLVLVVVVACRAAALRRPPAGHHRGNPVQRWRPAPAVLAIGLSGIALAAAAVAIAFVPFSAEHAIGYTELWMRPDNVDASVRIGVGNEEHDRTAYDLRVKFGGGVEAVERTVELDPGDEEVLRVLVPPIPSTTALPVFVTLSRADQPDEVYRRVNGWVQPPEAGSP